MDLEAIKSIFSQLSPKKLTKVFAQAFESDTDNVHINEDGLKQQDIQALLSNTALSSLLPYRQYDEQTSLFYNDRSMSFMLSVVPAVGVSQEMIDILHNLLTDVLPDFSDVQFLMVASDKVSSYLYEFENARSKKGGVYAMLANRRANFFRQGIHQSITTKSQSVVRNFQLYLTISLPKSLFNADEMMSLRDNVCKSLQSIHIPSRLVSIAEFITHFGALISPNQNVELEPTRWKEKTSLDLQMTDPECLLRVNRGELAFERQSELTSARCLIATNPPDNPCLRNMGDNIGQLFNSALRLQDPFVLSLTLRILPRTAAQSRYETRKNNLYGLAHSSMSRLIPQLVKQYQDNEYMAKCLAEGDKAVKYYYQVVVYADPSRINQAERLAKDVFKANGWTLKAPWAFQLPAWLMMLPMTSAEGLLEEMERMGHVNEMTAFNAVNMLPILAEWKGTQSPSLALIGRRGQLSFWDPFDNPQGNYNMCIVAKSGSGKSVFAQEYMVSMLSQGGRVWVIDAGRSYEKTCRLLGGTFVEFSKDNAICINPFTSVVNINDSLAMLKPLIASMAHSYEPITDEEYVFIEMAIKAVWEVYGNQSTITHVSDWLAHQEKEVAKTLSRLLYSFTKEGLYGRYFEGESTIDLSNELVVLELDDLKQQKELQRIVLMVLIYHITQNIYLSDRGQRKNCIIEEIWDMFKGTHSALAGQFIEEGVRTARRFGAGFIGISQSFADFHQNDMTRAMYDNADFKIILSQEYESIERAKDQKYFHMDAFDERVLKSLHTVSGEYSEFAIKGFQGLTVHRLFLDPYSSLLYSSRAEEFQYIRDLESQGLPLSQALEKAAVKFRIEQINQSNDGEENV